MGTYRGKSNAFWGAMQNMATVFSQNMNPQKGKIAKRMNELSAKRDAEGSLSFQDAEELRQLEYKSGVLDTSTDVNLRNKALAPISLKPEDNWREKLLFKERLLRGRPKSGKPEKRDNSLFNSAYKIFEKASIDKGTACSVSNPDTNTDCIKARAAYIEAGKNVRNYDRGRFESSPEGKRFNAFVGEDIENKAFTEYKEGNSTKERENVGIPIYDNIMNVINPTEALTENEMKTNFNQSLAPSGPSTSIYGGIDIGGGETLPGMEKETILTKLAKRAG